MAETIGSLIDKISIAELKIFHMREQIERTDATTTHRQQCSGRLAVLERQRTDLTAELDTLLSLWKKGRWAPKVYRQFKMYNDPQYRLKAETARAD